METYRDIAEASRDVLGTRSNGRETHLAFELCNLPQLIKDVKFYLRLIDLLYNARSDKLACDFIDCLVFLVGARTFDDASHVRA
jgi:hypothetical protein